MPQTTAPRIWLAAVTGPATRPQSAMLTTRETRIRRVVSSTRTSTKWATKLNAVKVGYSGPAVVDHLGRLPGRAGSSLHLDIVWPALLSAARRSTGPVSAGRAGGAVRAAPRGRQAGRWRCPPASGDVLWHDTGVADVDSDGFGWAPSRVLPAAESTARVPFCPAPAARPPGPLLVACGDLVPSHVRCPGS